MGDLKVHMNTREKPLRDGSRVVNICSDNIDLSLINGYISQKKRVDLCKHPLSSCCDRATLRMAFRTRSAS